MTTRGLLSRVALALLSSALVVMAADLLLRPLLRQSLHVRPTIMFRNRWPENDALLRYDQNVRYRGKMYGGLAVILGDPDCRQEREVYFETDELGFRNKPRSRHAKNTLIVLGDSFGAGSGGSQEHMVAHHLSERHGIANYNLSVGGFSPWQELITFQQEASRINLGPGAGVLWLLFAGNDLDDPPGESFDIRANNLLERLAVRMDIFYKRSPIRLMLQPRVDRRKLIVVRSVDGKKILFFNPYLKRARRSRKEVLAHPNVKPFERTFQRMAELCAARELRLHVVLVPSKEETYPWILDDGPDAAERTTVDTGLAYLLETWADAAGVDFLDLSPLFARIAKEKYEEDGSLLFWRDDTHWNDQGQAIAAAMISRFVRRSRAGAEPGAGVGGPDAESPFPSPDR